MALLGRSSFTILVAALVLGAGTACGGESASEKAKSEICDASSDIQTQINNLKGMNAGTATLEDVNTSLTAIKNAGSTIGDAIPDLDGNSKLQLQTADETFALSIQSTLLPLFSKETSLAEARSQLPSAVATLASSYKQTYGTIGC